MATDAAEELRRAAEVRDREEVGSGRRLRRGERRSNVGGYGVAGRTRVLGRQSEETARFRFELPLTQQWRRRHVHHANSGRLEDVVPGPAIARNADQAYGE